MLSTTLENMSVDLEKNNNVNDYLNEVPEENKLCFLDNAINELKSYITSKTKGIFKIFSSIFIIAMLISIVAMLFYQPVLQNEFEKKNLVHEKLLDIQSKDQKKLDDAEVQDMQRDVEKSTKDLYSQPFILYSLLGFGLLVSLFAFVLPMMILSIRKISLRKYRNLLSELQDQKYIFLAQKETPNQ
ncbi:MULTISPECIES: hypothetical protein [Staphylococcus]|uniref:hypothetical protein n=1 Tax=Staphylococcus TaxID=1279 RepID=UPI0011A4FA22|nr:hypothetical protein [Staphylococcus hominis]